MTITEQYGLRCDAPDCTTELVGAYPAMTTARRAGHAVGWATVRLGNVAMLQRDTFDYCRDHAHLADEHPDAFQPTVERPARFVSLATQADATPPFAELLHQAVTDAHQRARQAVTDQGGNPDEWTFSVDPDAPIGSIVITATPPQEG